MKLVNSTPVPAEACMIPGLRDSARGVLIAAVATFEVADDGTTRIDRETPLPVRPVDAETPDGLLPPALVPKLDARFEVMVLGRVHSPTGHPVRETEVGLSVGAVERRLVVTGNRVWEGRGEDARIGAPDPFTELPMDWSRAYGGTAEICIDEGAALDVADARNAMGRGFDHFAQAEALASAFRCPDGYPTAPRRRPLPNIEDPADRVSAWDDAPLPVCWAPAPVASGIIAERARRYFGEDAMSGEGAEAIGSEDLVSAPIAQERAHPDWVIATPPEHAVVRLGGMCPHGRELVFRLPRARIRAEIREGVLDRLEAELHPRALVLLPETRRFALVFRGGRILTYHPDESRTVRIVAERGWVPPPPDEDDAQEDEDEDEGEPA